MAPITFIDTSCVLCGNKNNYSVLYKKNIPPGSFSKKVFSARRTPDKIHYRMVKCNNDGQVRSHPIIKPSVLYSLYRKSGFTYQDEIPNLTATYVKALLPTLKKLGKKARVLEVGCGNGFVLSELYKRGYKNVFGIDPSIDAKDAASTIIKKRIQLGILHNRSYKKESFNLICLFQTLDHIPNPAAFIKLCKSYLAPGGYLIAFNHDVESFSARLLGERSPIIDIEHIYLFSKKTVQVLFENSGFLVSKVYSPWNTLSLSHLIHLLPLPKAFKRIGQSFKRLTSLSISIPLGNLCIIAQKSTKKV
jgi:SAM-dependent methyltransferase